MSLRNKTILGIAVSATLVLVLSTAVLAQEGPVTQSGAFAPYATLWANTYNISSGQTVQLSYASQEEAYDDGSGGVGSYAPSNTTCSGNFPVSYTQNYGDGTSNPGSAMECENDDGAGCTDWESEGSLYSGTDTMGPLTQTTTYTFTCTNHPPEYPAAQSSESVTINVAPAACTSSANSCGQTNSGYVEGGSCNASTPADPWYYGTSCSATSAANSCGQTNTNYGSYNCSDACTASTPAPPANPSYYGTSCSATSAANSCGQTNTNYGTYNCSDQCSASQPTAPSNSQCGSPVVSCAVSPSTTMTGSPVTWSAAASGGTGSGYSYSWSGPDLNGDTGPSVQASYSSSGTYTGAVTVTDSAGNSSGQVACTAGGGNNGQNGSANVVVSEPPTPTATLTASPSPISEGDSSKLYWSSTNATSCTASGGFSTGGATSNSSGVSTGALTQTSTYQITCSGPGGTSAPAQAIVTVLAPSTDITASPLMLPSTGGSTAVSWSASNVDTCSVSGTDGYSSGTIASAGGMIATTTVHRSLTDPATYTITCPTQGISDSVIVNVAPGFQEF